MTTRAKWLTILACLVFLLLAAGVGLFRPGASGGKIASADDLNGAKVGGVEGRMPASSALIFFRSLTGRKISGYTAYGSVDEALCALKGGSVDVIWTADVTARYLMEKDESLAQLDTKDMSAIENTKEARFSFGMAAPATVSGKALIERIDYALDFIKGDGILDELTQKYIEGAADAGDFTAESMVVNDEIHRIYYHSSDPIVVGITGAVPPIDMLNEKGEPTGFCVALMDEIGQVLQRGVKFVVLDNDTAFSALMSGKVDVLFAYGSGRVTTETARNWVVSEGYCDMQRYEFLYLK